MDQIDATSCDSSITAFDRVGMATCRAGAFRLTDVDPTGDLPDQMRKNGGGEFCATDPFTDEFAQVARN